MQEKCQLTAGRLLSERLPRKSQRLVEARSLPDYRDRVSFNKNTNMQEESSLTSNCSIKPTQYCNVPDLTIEPNIATLHPTYVQLLRQLLFNRKSVLREIRRNRIKKKKAQRVDTNIH